MNLSSQINSPNTLAVEISASHNFVDWLLSEQISLVFSTYPNSRLMLLGVDSSGRISGLEQVFHGVMGLYATTERIYLGSRYEIWQLDNVLAPRQLYSGCDKLYIPRISYTTGDLNIHDLALEAESSRIVFISSLLNCLATVSDRHSCIPLWKPPFISQLINEDRCHLNGLAMVNGKPRYVTLYGLSDIGGGWREHSQSGGCVIDIISNEVIASGLSLPHSPRFAGGKLWLLNAGTGEFGYIELKSGKFQPLVFCPGFLRGLAFYGDYTILGLSQPDRKPYSGLKLDETLVSQNTQPFCGLLVIDLKTGTVAHSLHIIGEVTQIYDVQVLPSVRCPQALGLNTKEIQQIITLDPRSIIVSEMDSAKSNPEDALYHQALALQNQGQFSLAFDLYQQIIGHNNQYALAWYQMGVIMEHQGETEKAVLNYEQVLKTAPNHAETHNNLGIIRVGYKDLEGAIACFTAAIQSNPDYIFAHNNLGLVWQMQGKYTEAIAKFQFALQKSPTYAEAYLNLGVTLENQHNLEGATNCYRLAIHYKPNYIKAINRLGIILFNLSISGTDHLDEAKSLLEKVLQLQPSSSEAFTCLFYLQEFISDWRSRQENLARLWEQTRQELLLGKTPTITPFDTIYKPWDRHILFQIARSFGQAIADQWMSVRQSLDFTYPKSRTGRLRIGYLSNDFRNHAICHLIKGLFKLHNHSDFEIFAYSCGPDDNSEYRQEIVNSCEHFHDINNLKTEDSARLIFEHGIHILVDLSGYTAGSCNSISALRPAPIQVNYLGFPGTMGADFIDYMIGDAVVTPPEFADSFSEKLVLLPHSYQVNDINQAIATTTLTRSQYGLPESGFVFCSFNNSYKIEPTIFQVWMNILSSVPDSVLWLFPRFTMTENNLKKAAQAHGIPAERLVFAKYEPKAQHLARHRLANLFLDTIFYNAHTTASDALWAGLPLITCLGNTFAARVAASLLTAVGLPELITTNLEDYTKLAINLAKSPQRMQQLCKKLADNRLSQPLFDTPRFTRNLERAYLAMWDIYAAGQPPRAIKVMEDGGRII